MIVKNEKIFFEKVLTRGNNSVIISEQKEAEFPLSPCRIASRVDIPKPVWGLLCVARSLFPCEFFCMGVS